MKKILIFDFDGVVVDSFDLCMDVYLRSCKRNGYYVIKSKKHLLEMMEVNLFESLIKLGLTKEDIGKIVKGTSEERLISKEPKMFAGMKKILEKLSQDNIMYIVTSTPGKSVKNTLKFYGLDAYFKDVYGPEKSPSKIKKLNFIKTKHKDNIYFFISDTVGDIAEGNEAGVETVAVSWGWHNKAKLLKVSPKYFVEKPGDLLKLFK
ncbi:MAG: HAD hydrolase-like protein [Candidatus Buchananbacteria bacterium]